MDIIHRNSKTTSHFSIQYLLAGSWQPERIKTVEFEKALLDNGLDFSETHLYEKGFVLTRSQPSPLQIKIESPGPQVMTIGVLSQNPQYDLEMFCRDAQAVTLAFERTWPAEHYQLLTTTGKIHHLYSSGTHAFKYLWEERLGQFPQDFAALGNRPVAGGGLRLLMPPHAVEGSEPVSIELRIESFLRETNKLFVETVFTWPRPRMVNKNGGFDPQGFMEQIENFAANEVWTFMTHTRNPQD
ncbi:MAG: hypothetical protein L0Y36_01445 [Planctomycetales bacterium]|nr:hypothetical protein [Planctomycetales bacterium]